jgi:serine/threonine protein kinase
MATICPSCGEDLPASARFCPGCGTTAREVASGVALAETLASSSGPGVGRDAEIVDRDADTVPDPEPHPPLVAVASTDPLIGATVAGRFKVSALLGAGGMGTVYQAEQIAVGRQVVLKFLHPHLFSQSDLIERFHREALAASKLACPNTIVLYDFGEAEGAPGAGQGAQYMAMEFLEGRQLTEEIRARGALPPLRAVAITLQMLASLEEAHDKGIVHRDLKPDNIMLVNRSGTTDFVKVLDFGIAKLMDQPEAQADEPVRSEDDRRRQAELLKTGQSQLTQQGAICGSPGYMSPEQVLGLEVDHRTDLYAVGVILYQMIAGRRPHQGSNVWELMQNTVDVEVESLTRSRPDLALPRPLDRLILDCLQREPDDRPASAGELAVRLRALTSDLARQRQDQERALLELVGIRRRWPRWLTLGALPAVVLALLALVGWLALGTGTGSGDERGVGLAPGDRLFVSAAAPKVPGWVTGYPSTARPAGSGVVRGVSDGHGATAMMRWSRRDAGLRLVRAEVLGRVADVPPRFDPHEDAALYRADLELVAQRARALQTAAQRRDLFGIETYWSKLAVGRPGGAAPGYSYDCFARMKRLSPGVATDLRREFAELRYDRYNFLADETTRAGRCAAARAAAAKVREAIKQLPKKKKQKQRLRFILKLRLKKCLARDAGASPTGDAG